MKTKIQDMTSGSPGRLIILFAIPLMLGNICQQLYTMVDTMVVGQIAGVEALAALGAVDFLMWVVTGISTGLTQGFSIQLSQYYGAKNFENLRKSLAHSYRLTAFIAVGVFILSQSFASLILTGLHTPSNIIGMSLLYLRIIFCGIPATAAYNMFASMPILSLGGIGVISVLSNVAPKETHNMVMDYLNGDVDKARQMQLKAIPLIDALFSEVNPIPVKKALNLMGWEAGPLRAPLTEMEASHAEVLKKTMKDFGIKVVD